MAPRERERSLGGGCAAGGAAGAALLHGLVHLPAGDPHRPVRCRRTSQQPGCAGARQEPTSPTASSLQETSQPTSQPNTRQQGNKHSTGRTQRRRPWWGSQRRPAGEGSGVMRGGSRGGGRRPTARAPKADRCAAVCSARGFVAGSTMLGAAPGPPTRWPGHMPTPPTPGRCLHLTHAMPKPPSCWRTVPSEV